MLLDRIDIDAHGPLHCVELGPFAEHLNVVCGPPGSGKTAIARFLRDSLVSRDYPLGMLSSSTGRVVWADRHGKLHCRRERDGTAHGRRTVEFESRGDFDASYAALHHSWLGGDPSGEAGLAHKSMRLPETLVDGIVTDTAVTSVARVVSACVRSGLDSPDAYRALPLFGESIYHDRGGYQHAEALDIGPRYEQPCVLREELAAVEAELAQLGSVAADEPQLLDRRNWLAARLSGAHRFDSPVSAYTLDRPRRHDLQRRLGDLHDRARRLRARQEELHRWIAEIDRDIAHRHPAYTSLTDHGDDYRAVVRDESLRRRLDDLDAQMIRWRRALVEVRGLRQTLLSRRDPLSAPPISPLDESELRRMRLDGFLHAIDRYDRSRNWDDLYPESYRPLHHIDDIGQRIDSATRQIDWLLERYAGADKPQSAWYAPVSYRSTSSLGDALQAIREDLRQVKQVAFGAPARGSYAVAADLEELRLTEQWLVASIERLNRHREALLVEHAVDRGEHRDSAARDHSHDRYVLGRERSSSLAELDRVSTELDACLGEAAEIRRRMRGLPLVETNAADPGQWLDRDALLAELRSLDERLAAASRARWLRTRLAQLRDQLSVEEPRWSGQQPLLSRSPLAEAASRWLIRLSAGRLQGVDWPAERFSNDSASYHSDQYQRTGVTIGQRDESQCPATDRALAAMAVRLAAGDLLARSGRHVPLVFETHAELVDEARVAPLVPPAYHEHGSDRRSNHPIAAALRDYARSGRQVVVLTSSQELTTQLARVGARAFQIHAERIVHAHRPLWRAHYDGEHYSGPHPHTYALHDAEDVLPRTRRKPAPPVDINRDFDTAWREAYAFYDNPEPRTSPRTDWARDGVDFRDGYYFTDTFTTANRRAADDGRTGRRGLGQEFVAAAVNPAREAAATTAAPASPFFLSVDSPVDQAPSVDAVAAARLRGLNVTHINHLLHQDSNRLADALGLASVDAATIRRWQSECRLVCRVPHLRGFDARVLVGCGVTTPAQLAATHPVDLLQLVERFLATDRGQQILLSGSSQELSRITRWLAEGNSSRGQNFVGNPNRSSDVARPQPSRAANTERSSLAPDTFDRDRYEYEDQPRSRSTVRRRRRIIGATPAGDVRGNAAENNNRRDPRSITSGKPAASSGGQPAKRRTARSRRHSDGSATPSRKVVPPAERHGRSRSGRGGDFELRFYLNRHSPIVDAPAIGERMGERLRAIGIETVDDLFKTAPEAVAAELGHRRIDADTIVQWQQQAALVCRVPQLRGHDAQLLVAVGVTTAEELAAADAEELLAAIDPIARSEKGKSILRGGKLPDLDEIHQWIEAAQHQRDLRAA
jgi:hypothetical protein